LSLTHYQERQKRGGETETEVNECLELLLVLFTSLPTIEGEKVEEEMAEQHTFSVTSFTGLF